MSRETVSRIISELRNEGFISTNENGEIEISIEKFVKIRLPDQKKVFFL